MIRKAPTQLSVLTEVAPFMTSEGISVAALDQNHTLMKLLVRSTAYLSTMMSDKPGHLGINTYHPPPFELKMEP